MIKKRLLVLICVASACFASKRRYGITTVRNVVAPIGTPFGFLAGGHFELKVFNHQLVDLKKKKEATDLEAGFFLRRFENEAEFTKYMEILRSNRTCIFPYDIDDDPFAGFDDQDFENHGVIESAKDGILLSMRSKAKQIEYTFKPGEEGLYFLIYQVCPYRPWIRSKFEVEYHWFNIDRYGSRSYLPAGEMILPTMFFFFAVSYFMCFMFWATNIWMIRQGGKGLFNKDSDGNGRPVIYAIHQFMSVLIFLKFAAVFSESIRYHFIRVHGSAEVWSFIYYVINFVKGTFLFTVILLIGSGWSFIKAYLNSWEKKVILFVLVLQVVNNIALAVLSQEISGERGYDKWTALLHLADIICCCAVLVPIVWQVNALEQSMNEREVSCDEERQEVIDSATQAETLSKLRLFRSFYLLVVAYIYGTRILIYLFSTVLDYQHIWARYFIVELITLTFYVTVGIMFRPLPQNPYLSVNREDAEDEVTLIQGESEMVNRSS